MKAKTKPNGSNGQRPKPAPTHDGDNRSFCGKAMKILDWACTGSGKWEWPIDRPTGSSNEGWVSSFFYKLEKAFDPMFYECKRKSDELNFDYQKRKDTELMTRQRDLAAALWECDPELAGRYAEILRIVVKPAGLANVDKRVAFLQEIERRENLTKGKDIAQDRAEPKNTSKALSEKRAEAAKGNRTVKNKYDRAVIKVAVLRKIKQGYTSNQAHNEVADRCRENQNLLKLKNGPYSFISARSVGRIVMNK